MPEMHIKIIGLHEAIRHIEGYPRKCAAVLRQHKTLRKIGNALVASAVETYQVQGRPKWADNADSTKARKLAKYKKLSGIMVETGQTRQSLDFDVEGGQLYLSAASQLKYNQFEEGRTKTKAPARPVWGVHPDDLADIKDIIIEDIIAKT